jgi:hypothetical protein
MKDNTNNSEKQQYTTATASETQLRDTAENRPKL